MKNLFPLHLLPLALLVFSAVDCTRTNTLSAKPAPAVPQTAGEKLDSLFTTIADGDDTARSQAIETLHKLLVSDYQELREIAKDYANDVNPPTFTPVPNQKRCALLLRAIPRLISRVDGKSNGQAYGILLFIQPYSPAPDRQTWEKWWEEQGRAKYAAMAGAG